MKRNILVTAIGTITATSIVKQLKQCSDKFYVIGADINQRELVVSSKDVDEYHVFPSAVENQNLYLKFVVEFCKKYKVDYLFPVIDEEIVTYSDNRKLFESIGVKLCIPNKNLVDTCHYKNVFSDWIFKNIPKIYIKTFAKECVNDYPVFVKPIEGRASDGCRVVNTKLELEQIKNLENYVIQELIQGEIITVDVLRNESTGKCICIPRKELLRNKNGCGIAVKIIHDEILEEICSDIAIKLKLNGVINIEFFKIEQEYKVIEINPRFSAGSEYSYLAGCNLALEAIAAVDGTIGEHVNIVYGKNYARRYETYEL